MSTQKIINPIAASILFLSFIVGGQAKAATRPPASTATPVAEAAATPAMLSFGDIMVGKTGTQTLTVSNSSNARLTIKKITLEGAGFSVNRSYPISVDAGSRTKINFLFKPTVAGSLIGRISIISNAVNSTITIPMTAAGVVPNSNSTPKSTTSTTTPIPPSPTTSTTTSTKTSTSTPNPASTYILSASSTSLGFGSIDVGSSGRQTLTLIGAGNANIVISNVIVSGPGFNASGVSAGTILTPGQSVTVTAIFAPASTGNSSGSISISSNASNGTETIALSGTGAPQTHSVQLSWLPSASNVIGYNVYVSSTSDGTYTKLTSSPVTAVSYNDGSLQSSQTRYYVVTSVDSSNQESAFSNQVSAIIP
jgi:hypothetical protein